MRGPKYANVSSKRLPTVHSLPIWPSIIYLLSPPLPRLRMPGIPLLKKPAKLETGVEINVPLFITQGEKIKVDTETKKYMARANE